MKTKDVFQRYPSKISLLKDLVGRYPVIDWMPGRAADEGPTNCKRAEIASAVIKQLIDV